MTSSFGVETDEALGAAIDALIGGLEEALHHARKHRSARVAAQQVDVHAPPARDRAIGLNADDAAQPAGQWFPEPEVTLNERVGRFELALMSYDREEFGQTNTLTDLLADARHWCDAKELDFSRINRTAYDHYLNERKGKGD